MTEKIGFLFLTRGEHNNISIWESYFENVDPSRYKILVHPKEPNTLLSPLWKQQNSSILRPIPTGWGTISLVKATLCLLQMALTDPLIKKFILLSESCIPMSSFDLLYDCLHEESNRSRIYWSYGKNHDRYHFIKGNISQVIPIANWMKQSQWMCLDRKHVSLLFLPIYQKRLLKTLDDFSYCPAPDEHFFIKYFIHFLKIHPNEFINYPNTYVDWNVSCKHPKLFGYLPSELVRYCREKKIFFARKFAPLRLSREEILDLTQIKKNIDLDFFDSLFLDSKKENDTKKLDDFIFIDTEPLNQEIKEPVLDQLLEKIEEIEEIEEIEKIENQSSFPKETEESLLQLSMETEPSSEEIQPEEIDQESMMKEQLIEYINQTSSRLIQNIEDMDSNKLKLFSHILSGNKEQLSSILTAFIYMEELSNDP